MALVDSTLIVLAAVLFFGLVVPELFKKFQLPFATSLIIVGSLFGPNGLNYLQTNDSLELFGFLGAAFLMLLSGLEARSDRFENLKKAIFSMSIINSLIPFVVGYSIVLLFGYSLQAALLIGVIFISSSAALVFSTIKTLKLGNHKIGQIVSSVVIVEDIISLFLLTVLIQSANSSRFPLIIYLGLLVSSVMILRMFLPELTTYYFKKHKKHDEYETHLRIVIALLLVVLIIYSGMGVNPIVASFLVGLILAKVPKFEIIKKKLHTIGYGIFVPIFFFIVGMQTDFKLIMTLDLTNYLMISIILGLFFSKFISGYMSAKSQGFKSKEAVFFGSISTSKLTTALSATFAAFSVGIIDSTLLSSIVMMSVISTIVGPALTIFLFKKQGEIND